MKLKTDSLMCAVASAVVLTLAGCGGGGGGSSGTVASSSTVTVSPALGKFGAGARITIRKPTNLSGEIGHADTGANGKAVVTLEAGYAGPMVIEVTGGPTVTYYDEGTKTSIAFGASDKLRAVAPAVQTELGVTTATNAAVSVLEGSGSISSTVSADDIKRANAKVEAALGIADVLQAPKLVDASSSGLNLSNADDKYALQLAALAKLATGGNNALKVAKDIAADLKDGKLDGKDGGVNLTGRSTSYTTDFRAQHEVNLKSASDDLADADTRAVVASDPTTLGTVIADVSNLQLPTGATLTDLQKAKAMFAELRSTFNSISNSHGTGFADLQATARSNDVNAHVGPAIDKVIARLGTMGMAIGLVQDAQNYSLGNTHGLVVATNPEGSNTLMRTSGNIYDVYRGTGSRETCWTDSATGVTAKVTCSRAGPDSYDPVANKIKFLTFVMNIPTVSGNLSTYAYTAKRFDRPVTSVVGSTVNLGTAVDRTLTTPAIPAGSGSFVQTTASGATTNVTLSGTMPPSTNETGVDTLAINVSKTLLSGSTHRYALSGSVSTANAADSSKVVSIGLSSGSFIDADESNVALNGLQPVNASLVSTIQTSGTRFTGLLTASSFLSDADGRNYGPTSVTLAGSLSDLSGGGGTFLTGQFVMTENAKAQFHSLQAESASNYRHDTLTFTGTVMAPSRPVLNLVLSGTVTSPTTSTFTISYTYGTVVISGSGATNQPVTLTNQDGIQIVLPNDNSGIRTVKKSGTTLATVTQQTINYIDGSSESLF